MLNFHSIKSNPDSKSIIDGVGVRVGLRSGLLSFGGKSHFQIHNGRKDPILLRFTMEFDL